MLTTPHPTLVLLALSAISPRVFDSLLVGEPVRAWEACW